MLPTSPAGVPARPSPTAGPARALLHVLLAGLLGILSALVGAPVVIASTFGGWTAVLVALAVVTAVACALAVALDRTAGPGGCGRPGSLSRGIALGLVSSGAVAVLGYVALQEDIGDGLPVMLRYAAAGLPFAAVAGLQWPGVVRIVTAVVLVGATAAVAIPHSQHEAREVHAERVVTEVGTTEPPWVTEADGYRLSASQVTGTPLIWTRLERADLRPDAVLWLFRDDPVNTAAADPCAATSLWTPDGDQPMTSCGIVRDGVWLRASAGWQELARYEADVRVGVTAAPEVPVPVLEQALAAARPMTDDAYAVWLDEGLTPGR
ncbi:hypothetical protein [Blastococcus xanthinilyticus]|uniref:hypothetical protein n=1 Tax=Blastococcus xanthinilyticus TaxID=1564164 RepID=UPI001411CD2E|nr:hypothetical protein [Blastococcus xanthinilyticus]